MASSEGSYHRRGPYFDGTNFASWKLISKNMSTCLEIEVSIKIKYGHEGIMFILITTTYIDFVI